MTVRALGVLAGGGAAVGWGWHAGWPELTAVGTAGLVWVVLTLLVVGRSPRMAAVDLEQSSLRVVRGQPATVRMTVTVPRRSRWLRVVEGQPSRPVGSLPLPRRSGGEPRSIRLPLDTSRRGERQVGPYSIVHSDPWSLVRRVVARVEGGTLTVQPRSFPVRRSALPSFIVGDSEQSSRRLGDEHFFALRDYVMGDEPRMVHWRSSARAGKLVVKQQVAAATTGTTVILDTDTSAYGSEEAFGSGWLADRFEAAVEVAASLVTSQAARAEQVHVATTSRGASVTSAPGGRAGGLLDALAVVDAIAPVGTLPEDIWRIARHTRCARLIVVTGTPTPRTLAALRSVAMPATAVVRVGARQRPMIRGVRVLDIERPEDLS